MIHYTDTNQLSPKEFVNAMVKHEQAGAKSITVLIEQDGDVSVFSPYGVDLTQATLLQVAAYMPVGTVN